MDVVEADCVEEAVDAPIDVVKAVGGEVEKPPN